MKESSPVGVTDPSENERVRTLGIALVEFTEPALAMSTAHVATSQMPELKLFSYYFGNLLKPSLRRQRSARRNTILHPPFSLLSVTENI
jgi:hypothetical protein